MAEGQLVESTVLVGITTVHNACDIVLVVLEPYIRANEVEFVDDIGP